MSRKDGVHYVITNQRAENTTDVKIATLPLLKLLPDLCNLTATIPW